RATSTIEAETSPTPTAAPTHLQNCFSRKRAPGAVGISMPMTRACATTMTATKEGTIRTKNAASVAIAITALPEATPASMTANATTSGTPPADRAGRNESATDTKASFAVWMISGFLGADSCIVLSWHCYAMDREADRPGPQPGKDSVQARSGSA